MGLENKIIDLISSNGDFNSTTRESFNSLSERLIEANRKIENLNNHAMRFDYIVNSKHELNEVQEIINKKRAEKILHVKARPSIYVKKMEDFPIELFSPNTDIYLSSDIVMDSGLCPYITVKTEGVIVFGGVFYVAKASQNNIVLTVENDKTNCFLLKSVFYNNAKVFGISTKEILVFKDP